MFTYAGQPVIERWPESMKSDLAPQPNVATEGIHAKGSRRFRAEDWLDAGGIQVCGAAWGTFHTRVSYADHAGAFVGDHETTPSEIQMFVVTGLKLSE